MSALFDFRSFTYVLLLSICSCTYVKLRAPSLLSERTGFRGLFWKFARVGERLSPWIISLGIMFVAAQSGSLHELSDHSSMEGAIPKDDLTYLSPFVGEEGSAIVEIESSIGSLNDEEAVQRQPSSILKADNDISVRSGRLQRNVSWADFETGAALENVKEYIPEKRTHDFATEGCLCLIM